MYAKTSASATATKGIRKLTIFFRSCLRLAIPTHPAKTNAKSRYDGSEPIKITTTPKNAARAAATGTGKYLLLLTNDMSGNGNNKRRNAIVEKDEPVGVKLTALAKSNGRKTLKNEKK